MTVKSPDIHNGKIKVVPLEMLDLFLTETDITLMMDAKKKKGMRGRLQCRKKFVWYLVWVSVDFEEVLKCVAGWLIGSNQEI